MTTLIEAIKSGKRFKRPLMADWCQLERNSFYQFTPNEILKDDWIIEEPKPKRRLYLTELGRLSVTDNPEVDWTPLSKAEFMSLFDEDSNDK